VQASNLSIQEERYRLTSRSTDDLIWDWDIPASQVTVSNAIQRLFGYSEDPVVPLDWWREHIHPDDLSRVLESIDRTLAGRETRWGSDYRLRRADGSYADVSSRGFVVRASTGAPVRMVGSLTDVSERAQLESQLRQAQKMEAVGQLAGGVAHDFNNILTSIKSYAQLLLADIPASDPRHRDVGEIARAADRAAELTRQLLAFSRRQMLQPRVLDLNRVIVDVERMLQPLMVGDVRLLTELEPGSAYVEADPGQIQQVLVNLVLNARDAMPRGGTVTIRVANLTAGSVPDALAAPPGDWVSLSVSDSGTGMDDATRGRVFEPFFTTKEQGQGTGLGLSTAYGIVKQSGGSIAVDSEPGFGSTFTVYLPRTDKAPPISPKADNAGGDRAGDTTILVVDDDETVRSVIARVLTRRGYRVLEAQGGQDALAIASRDEPIALVVSDLTMPEMSGRELVERIRRQRPGVRVLLTSGFSAESFAGRGAAETALPFLEKPFTPDDILRKVSEALATPL
jgi:PAS domain S-box-containing protein